MKFLLLLLTFGCLAQLAAAQLYNDGQIRLRVWMHKFWSSANCFDQSTDPDYVLRNIQVRVPKPGGGFDVSPTGVTIRTQDLPAYRWYFNGGGWNILAPLPTGTLLQPQGILLFDQTYPGTLAPNRFEWRVEDFFENDCGDDWQYEGSCGFLGLLGDDNRVVLSGFQPFTSAFRAAPTGTVHYAQAEIIQTPGDIEERYTIMFAYQWDWVTPLPPLCPSPNYQDGPINLTVELKGVFADVDYDFGSYCTFGLADDEDLRLRYRSRDNLTALSPSVCINQIPGPLTIIDQGVPRWNNIPDGAVVLFNKNYTTADVNFHSFELDFDAWEEDPFPTDEFVYETDDDARVQFNTGLINWRDSPPNTWNFLDIPLRAGAGQLENWTVRIRYRWTINNPVITAEPSLTPAARCIGEPIQTLTATATNATFYQWQVSTDNTCPGSGWTDIPGANCATFSVPQTPGARLYRLLVFNRNGTGSTSDIGPRYAYDTSVCVPVYYFPFAPPIDAPTACGRAVEAGSTHLFQIPVVPGATGYLWSVTLKPGGAPDPIFSTPTSNSTNVTFPINPGTYRIRVTVQDPCAATDAFSECDIIVSGESCGFVFASPSGNPLGAGTITDPVTLPAAIAIANATPTRRHVRLLAGTYNLTQKIEIGADDIILDGDWEIVGGQWRKNNSLVTTVTIDPAVETVPYDGGAGTNVGVYKGVDAIGRNNFLIQDINFNVLLGGATGTTGGRGNSVYGFYFRNCTGWLVQRCNMTTGAGASGQDGLGSTPGWSAADPFDGAQGGDGGNGTTGDCDDQNAVGDGGAGGTGGGGAVGGAFNNDVTCCNAGQNGAVGAAGTGRNGGGGGAGGSAGSESNGGGTGGNGGNGGGGIGGTGGGGGGPAGGCGSDCNRDGRAGTNGTPGGNGISASAVPPPTSTTFNFYWLPNGQSANGLSDGTGGGGGKGGGGGAGQGGAFCIDGAGSGGGGGGGGGQGGLAGQGGFGGGGAFALYAFGGSGTTTDVNLVAGAAGAGGARGLGGEGGPGGQGGLGGGGNNTNTAGGNVLTGTRVCGNCEVGAGGRGGNGGAGGNGGDGQPGAAGVSAVAQLVSGAAVVNTTTSPATAQILTAQPQQGCTNSEIYLTKNGGATFDFANMGTPVLVPDIAAGVTTFTNVAGALNTTVYYTATGFYQIKQTGSNGWSRFIKINTNRPLPVINPIASPLCPNTAINLGTANVGVAYDWEIREVINFPITNAADLAAAPYFTSTLQNPGNVTVTNNTTVNKRYQIKLRVREECCGWSIPVYLIIEVYPEIKPGTIDADQTVCYNADPANFISLTPAGGGDGNYTYTWEQSTDGGFTWSAAAGVPTGTPVGLTFDPPPLTQTTRYRRKVNNICGTVFSDTITISILPELLPGTIGNDQVICAGGDPAAFVNLASPSGGTSTGWIYEWEQSTNCTGVWTPIAASNVLNYDVPAGLATTTCYRRSAINGCGPKVYSNTVTVNVNANPAVATMANQSRCGDGIILMEATLGAGGDIADFSDDGINVATSDFTAPYTYGVSVTVGSPLTIYVRTRNSTTGCFSPWVSATATATPAITVPVLSPAGPVAVCAPATVLLSFAPLPAPGVIITWKRNGSIIAVGGNTYTATTTGIYTVELSATGCATVISNASDVTINTPPTAPTITPAGPISFCTGSSVTLSIPPQSGATYQWKNGAVNVGTNLNVLTVTTSGTYSVEVTIPGCPVAVSTNTVTLTEVPGPVATTLNAAGATTVCAPATVLLSLVPVPAAGINITWKRDGITVATTGSTYTATVSGVYTAELSSVGCGTVITNPVPVTINSAPAAPTIVPAGPVSFCSPGSVTLSIPAVAGAGYQWRNGAVPVGTNSNVFVATASGSYSVEVSVPGCAVVSSVNTVTVNAIAPPAVPVITPAAPAAVCVPATVSLSIAPPGAGINIQWYRDGVAIAGANAANYTATVSGSYTVELSATGCPNVLSAAVIVTINSAPAAPTIVPAGPVSFCSPGSVTLSIPAVAGAGYQWRNGAVPVGTNSNVFVATASGSYSVEVSVPGCAVVSSVNTVTVNAIAPPAVPVITPAAPAAVCAPATVSLSIAPPGAGINIQWYRDGVAIAGANVANYTATVSGSYTVELSATGCPNVLSAAVIVTINSAPAAPTIVPAGPVSFCSPGSVTLSIPAVAGAGYQWRNGAVPVGTNSNVFVATASGSYSVEVSVPGCAVVSSVNTVTVNAIAPPAVPVITPAAPAAVCVPATVSLSIAPPGAGVNIQWYRDGVAIAGANAANYTATVSGSYTVELSATGCPNVLSAAVIVTINNPVAPFSIDNTLPLNICAGENVTLSISPPIAGATYQWKNGGTNVGTNSNIFVASASGTYTCEVSVPGCPPVPSTNSVVVTQDAIPATPGPISGPASLCAGGSGTYSIAAVPGATGYTWVLPAGWSGSSTTNSISVTAGSTGGNISVTANNDCGSSPVSIQALVVDPATPAPGAISGPASLCAGSSGSYSIAAVPGATGYTWVLPAGWTGSSTTNSITVTAGSTGGNISVLAIGPCGNSVTSVLAVSPAAAAVAPTITGVAAPCSSSVQIYAVGNVQTGVTYNWTITGGTPATASGSVVTINWGNGSTGNIEVSAVGPCNTATQNQAITLGVPQNVNIPTGPEVRCKGETGVYSVSPTAGNSYEWAVDGGVILSGQGTNSITVQWTTDSAGSVAVTESNSCGAGKPQTLAISIPTALPPGSIFPDTVACQNQKAVVYGLPKITGVSYFWTVSGGTIISGADSNIVLVDWGSGSSGSLTIQARSSCDTLIRTQVITLVAAPTLPTITGPDSICSGVAVNFRATGGAAGVSYQWSAIGGAIQSGQGTDAVTVFWGSSAPYRISVVAINGNCPSDTVSKNLNIGNNAPSLTPIIARRSVSCTGSTDTFSITTATGVSYNWAVTNGTILSGQGSNQIVVQFNVAGNSVISVVGQNGCGKDSTGINVNILEYNPPASIAGNDSICVGSSQNYSIVGQSGATYRWIAAGGTIVGAANGTSVQINWLSSGVNTVTVIEQHPCSLLVVERKIFVREDGTLGVIAGERRTCTSGLQTYRLVGGIPKGTNISWQAAGGSIIGVQNADSVVVRWDSVLSGVASIVAEAIGCSTQTVSLAVSLLPISKPVPVASKFIICAGDSIAFADSSRGIAGRWLWDFGDGFASSDSAPRHTFTRPGVYTVSLTTSISGQCEDSASIRTQIVVNSVPEGRILVAANPSNLSDQSALYFEGTGADTLYWYLSDSNIAVVDTFPFDSIRTNYKRADRYKVRVRAVSRGGCEVWDSTEVFIENFLLIDFPTAFSPNGDGNNDRLTFIHRGISDYTLEIYNRWGDLLFTGRPGQYWDGTYERKPLPEGVYVYVLKLPNGDTRKGSITLIR